jgi:hypothetical protein
MLGMKMQRRHHLPMVERTDAQKNIFSEETFRSLQELGKVLRRIHNRLIREGWIIKDGVFTPPPGYVPPKESRPWKRKNSQ